MSVEIKEITKTYGKQKAVNNISLTLKAGEITGFLGPNGAGKTTTMKMITGLVSADNGEVYVLGNNIKNNPIKTRKHIGYLPENNPLYTEMYIREYLEYVANIYLPKKECKESVERVIRITGLTKEHNKKISQLSKGYKQRIGLAQALIHNPDVLILDEPTTGLDPNQIAEIRDLIREVGKDKTVLLSTHIMQEVEAICDRVIIINDGQIVADDVVTNIVNNKSELITSVQFTTTINHSKLQEIEHINSVDNFDDNRFIIKSSEDIREEIFTFAVKNSYMLIELKLQQENLEDVFKKLTK